MILGSETGRRPHWTNPIWEQIRERAELFDGAFAASSTRFNLALRGESDFVDGMWASGNTFEELGVPAMLGRTFTAQDDQPGGGPDGPVAVIATASGSAASAERQTPLNVRSPWSACPYTIVGVTPPGFFGVDVGRTFDIAVPIGTATLIQGPRALEARSSWWLRIFIRLKPGQDGSPMSLTRPC